MRKNSRNETSGAHLDPVMSERQLKNNRKQDYQLGKQTLSACKGERLQFHFGNMVLLLSTDVAFESNS